MKKLANCSTFGGHPTASTPIYKVCFKFVRHQSGTCLPSTSLLDPTLPFLAPPLALPGHAATTKASTGGAALGGGSEGGSLLLLKARGHGPNVI